MGLDSNSLSLFSYCRSLRTSRVGDTLRDKTPRRRNAVRAAKRRVGELSCSQPHDLSFARIESEPSGFQPGFDVDETRIEAISGDRSFRRWHAAASRQRIG